MPIFLCPEISLLGIYSKEINDKDKDSVDTKIFLETLFLW